MGYLFGDEFFWFQLDGHSAKMEISWDKLGYIEDF